MARVTVDDLVTSRAFVFVPSRVRALLRAAGTCVRRQQRAFETITATSGTSATRLVLFRAYWLVVVGEKKTYWRDRPEVKVAAVDLELPLTPEMVKLYRSGTLPFDQPVQYLDLPLPRVNMLDVMLFRPPLPRQTSNVGEKLYNYGVHFKGEKDFWMFLNLAPDGRIQNNTFPTYVFAEGSAARGFMFMYLPMLHNIRRSGYLEALFAK